MKILISQVQALLKGYSYRLVYSAYHTAGEIKKYRGKKDAVDAQEYLTLLTPSGHVMGRMRSMTQKRKQLQDKELHYLLTCFMQYEVPSRNQIIKQLKALMQHA